MRCIGGRIPISRFNVARNREALHQHVIKIETMLHRDGIGALVHQVRKISADFGCVQAIYGIANRFRGFAETLG